MDFSNNKVDCYSFKKDLSSYGQILIVEMSPFNLSQDLILIGFENKIVLAHLQINERLDLNIIAEFNHKSRCTCISLSAETSLSILPNLILFAVGGSDYKLRVYNSDLKEDDFCRILTGHTNHINEMKFNLDNTHLVSVSDDNTAKIWDTKEFTNIITLNLTSPGVSTCWHRDDSSKLVIGEKSGLIRFYNIENQSPILSLDYGKTLSSMHWAPSNSQLLSSLQLGEILVWDLAKPCSPISSSLIFTENGGHIKFNSSGELIGAINNLDGHFKVINSQNHQIKLNVGGLTLPSNIAWHFRCPIVCFGDYTSLNLYKVNPK